MKNEAKANSGSVVVDLVEKWKIWRDDLKRYWPQIDRNQQMYEFSKDEDSLTSSNVSANTTFAIIEGQISKFNESKTDIITQAKGGVKVQPFEEYISSTLKYQFADPDIEALIGTFRERKEIYERDFLVKGNAVGEATYIYKEAIINGEKKIVADNPAFKNLPLKSVIFDPSSTLVDSDEYFVEKTTTYEKLKELEYNSKDGTGIYKNLAELKQGLTKEKDGFTLDDLEEQFYTGDIKINKKVKPVHILEHWRGAFLTVIADKRVVIREEYDPFGIGRNPLLPIMNYRVQGRPYAYGELDPIYKTVRAQDTILNQSIQAVNQFLKPSVLLQPGAKVSLDAIIAITEEGGIAYGDPKEVGQVPRTAPPQQAFLSMDVMQQIIERTARFSPYTSGVPNSKMDKTQGTMGGIIAMQEAAEPNFQVKIDKLQDGFMRPLARMFLKITANLTGDDEIKYSLVTGTNPEWVKVTKGILSGKATMQDLNMVGLVQDEDVMFFAQAGIPLDSVMAFDVDWVVDVKLDNGSKREKMQEVEKKMQFVQFAQKIGAYIEPTRAAQAIAYDMEIKNFNSMLMTEEEIRKQQMMAMQKQVMDMKLRDAQKAGEVGTGESKGGNTMSKTSRAERINASPNPEAQMATEIPTSMTPQVTTG